MATILIIDDNETIREGLAHVVKKMGHLPIAAKSGKEGLERFKQTPADFVITDLKMEGLDGVEVLRSVRELDPDCPAMIITAFGTVETAVEAMKLGAFDFLTKPFAPEVVRLKVERALELRHARRAKGRLEAENAYLRGEESSRFGELVGGSEPMRKVFAVVEQVAPTDTSVAIYGESGTGKELVARAIHQRSRRAGRPVHQGQLRRARRDAARERAVRPREGRVHRRHQAQARPLRARRRRHPVPRRDRRHLAGDAGQAPARPAGARVRARRRRGQHQGRRARGLGDQPRPRPRRSPRGASARISTTACTWCRSPSRRCASARATSRCWSSTSSPSWRRKTNPRVRGIDDAALVAPACAYRWPGNVRELENVIEQALVFADGDAITAEALPAALRGDDSGSAAAASASDRLPSPSGEMALPDLLDDLERQLILKAYTKAKGVKTETARLLGIKTSALYYKLEKYGIG